MHGKKIERREWLLVDPGAVAFQRASDGVYAVVAPVRDGPRGPKGAPAMTGETIGYTVGVGDSIRDASRDVVAEIEAYDAPAGPAEAADRGLEMYDELRGAPHDANASLTRVD